MIILENVSKTYGKGENACHALNNVSLRIDDGEFVSIIGKSGSGKTTLFNIVGGIDSEHTGKCLIDGIDLSKLSNDQCCKLRRSRIGIIYQFFNLVSYLTVKENMLLSAKLSHKTISEDKIDDVLKKLGLIEKKNAYVDELSGGQKQRVALGRVLLADSKIILADEPTGNLDQQNAGVVMDILLSLHKQGKTIVLITHDMDIANMAQRKIELQDGHVL